MGTFSKQTVCDPEGHAVVLDERQQEMLKVLAGLVEVALFDIFDSDCDYVLSFILSDKKFKSASTKYTKRPAASMSNVCDNERVLRILENATAKQRITTGLDSKT